MLIKKKKGMTVVELLIASLMLSIIFMGFSFIKIKSIYIDKYSENINLVSSHTNDFTALIRNQLSNADSAERVEIINNYKNGNWSSSSFDNLTNCTTSENIETSDYCSQDDMIDFNINELKLNIIKEIPNTRFNFINCENGSKSCLIISWNNSISLNERECKVNFNSCIVMEI